MNPKRYIVVDTNTLLAFVCPNSVDNEALKIRSNILFQSTIKSNWDGIRLYSPAICIAEALCVLDRYRFCAWDPNLRNNPKKMLSQEDYQERKKLLIDAVKTRKIEQLEQEPVHVLMTGLVSSVNSKFPLSQEDGYSGKRAMGAADCLIAGFGIHLVNRLNDAEAVLLVTEDYRMVDVLKKCQELTNDEADQLGLKECAEAVGIPWNNQIYPDCVSLGNSEEEELATAFWGWPLPENPLSKRTKGELSSAEEEGLVGIWWEVAETRTFTNTDNLAYDTVLCEIRCMFADRFSISMDCKEIFLFLLNKRKQGELSPNPPPSAQET